MHDNDIIALFFSRSQQAIEEASRKYGQLCYQVAYNILGQQEDSQEVVNDTWMKAWNSIPPQRPAFLQAYLCRITRNLAIDRFRKNSARRRRTDEFSIALEELADCAREKETVEDTVNGYALADCISKFLRRQPRLEADLFIRRYWYFESAAQLSQTYRMSENAVRLRLLRTRQKLRNHLIKEGFLHE